MNLRALKIATACTVAGVAAVAAAPDASWASAPAPEPDRAGRVEGATVRTSLVPLATAYGTNGSAGSAAVGGRMIFSAETESAGVEPWVTDGTPGGTHVLADIRPGAEGSDPRHFVPFRGQVYFFAETGPRSNALWRTDGTLSGTKVVREVPEATYLVRSGSRLFFIGFTTERGAELWASDGTAAGTNEVTDLLPGPESGVNVEHQLVPTRAGVVFSGRALVGVSKLWTSDGTAAGTQRLDAYPEGVDLQVGDFGVRGDRLVVAGGDARSGVELWGGGLLPGSVAGVKDIWEGTAGSHPRDFTPLGDEWLFTAADPAAGAELFVTDGTSGGTAMVRDLRAGAQDSLPRNFVPAGARVFFEAAGPDADVVLWATGGSAATTHPITLLTGIVDAYPAASLRNGGAVLVGVTGSGAPRIITTGAAATSALRIVQNGAVRLPSKSSVDVLGQLGRLVVAGVYVPGGRSTIVAWSTVSSRTTVPRRLVCRAGQRPHVRVAVRAAGLRPGGGTVLLEVAGRTVGRATLRQGTATVRARTTLRPGRYRFRAHWSGSIQAAGSSSDAGVLRVLRSRSGSCS
ncbi:hypothetical protein [Nocardioides sp.]|uniref:hypothetical protein n=1 Tax=Nocardioides sp. TaxID=35761 RepID=UPI0037833923